MTVTPDASGGASSGNWLFKNKEHGKMSAAASLASSDYTICVFPFCLASGFVLSFIITTAGYDFALGRGCWTFSN